MKLQQRQNVFKQEQLALNLSKAIREGKWVYVDYYNRENAKKKFFFAVKDIDLAKKILIGDSFNPELEQKSFPFQENITLYFDKLQYARITKNLSYDVPAKLLNTLDTCLQDQDWLNFNAYSNSLFSYLDQCIYYDNDPSVQDFKMLEGIDVQSFSKEKKIYLSEQDCISLVKKISGWTQDEIKERKVIRLALNILSVKKSNKNIPIVYKEVKIHFYEKKPFLTLSEKYQFSKTYLLGRQNNEMIRQGIDYNPEDFIKNFTQNRDECIEEIEATLLIGETINTNPEFMRLESRFNVDFSSIQAAASQMIQTKTLPAPIKAYLGKSSVQVGRRRNVAVVTYDRKVNIDQVRVIFNALRENITYVEGPPCTGKTQTILNVIFSQFFEGRTCLVSSHNNVPLEGIIEKLISGLPKCNDNEIRFPILRIGSISDMPGRPSVLKQTLKQVKELYEWAISKNKPKEKITQDQMQRFKKNTNALSEVLQQYEYTQELQQKISSLQSWYENAQENPHLKKYTQSEIEKLSKQCELNQVDNESIRPLCITAAEDLSFINFLYYHSIYLLQKLQDDKFSSFIKILYTENLNQAVKDFKDYLSNDENIALLCEVFPVWITTNISAEKIGSPKPHFDLCIMDESGQCDIAKSLIPIIRANRLLLVGDTEQLKPVIILDEQKQTALQTVFEIGKHERKVYDYVNSSILELMMKVDSISKRILLSYHYRCAKEIIQFSNSTYYGDKLKLENKTSGKVLLLDINNTDGPERNSYEQEATAVVEYIKTKKNVTSDKKIAIVTPFVNHSNLINQKLKENNITNAYATTIHKVQGAEYSTIIFSSAISKSTSKRTFK